jgi:hypothetical protein
MMDYEVLFCIPVKTVVTFDTDANGNSSVTGKPITELDAIDNAIFGFDHEALEAVFNQYGYSMETIEAEGGKAEML